MASLKPVKKKDEEGGITIARAVAGDKKKAIACLFVLNSMPKATL